MRKKIIFISMKDVHFCTCICRFMVYNFNILAQLDTGLVSGDALARTYQG